MRPAKANKKRFALLLLVLGVAALSIWLIRAFGEGHRRARLLLAEIYSDAKARKFKKIAGETYMEETFEQWEEERGRVQSFRIERSELWLPVWGEVEGRVRRRGKEYLVRGFFENGKYNYIDETDPS